MTEYLFSYGTLQTSNVQLALFGRLLTGAADSLKGYKLSVIEITDETFLSTGAEKYQRLAAISDNKNDVIEGTLLEVSGEELLMSDTYEPVEYKRINVVFESGKKGWIYAAAKVV